MLPYRDNPDPDLRNDGFLENEFLVICCILLLDWRPMDMPMSIRD